MAIIPISGATKIGEINDEIGEPLVVRFEKVLGCIEPPPYGGRRATGGTASGAGVLAVEIGEGESVGRGEEGVLVALSARCVPAPESPTEAG